MSFSLQKKWRFVIYAFLLIFILASMVPTGGTLSLMQIRQRRSDSSLHRMSELMLLYKNGHGGELPQNLNELVSDSRANLIKIFQTPHELTTRWPVEQLPNEAVINEFSKFAWPSNSNSKIMAFEKEETWPDGTVAVCFKDLSVKRMKVSAFRALLDVENVKSISSH